MQQKSTHADFFEIIGKSFHARPSFVLYSFFISFDIQNLILTRAFGILRYSSVCKDDVCQAFKSRSMESITNTRCGSQKKFPWGREFIKFWSHNFN